MTAVLAALSYQAGDRASEGFVLDLIIFIVLCLIVVWFLRNRGRDLPPDPGTPDVLDDLSPTIEDDFRKFDQYSYEVEQAQRNAGIWGLLIVGFLLLLLILIILSGGL